MKHEEIPSAHHVCGLVQCALWMPLCWLVASLSNHYAQQTPLLQFPWWEIALVVALIALPTQAIRALNLIPARDVGEI
jgi:hypothetical protein